MKKTGSIFLILISLLVGQFAIANSKVTAEVDRNQMGLGDPFTLSIHIESDEDFDVQEPSLPSMPGIEVINSTGQQKQVATTMSLDGIKPHYVTQVVRTFSFVLAPQKEGVLLVPVIDINLKGQNYKTNPIKIEVKEEFRNARSNKQQRGRPRFPPGFGDDDDEDSGGATGANPFGAFPDAEDIFKQMLKQRGQLQQPEGQIPSRDLKINPNDNFFVYLDLDKTQAYEGEQVTANWYIYTKAGIDSLDRVKFPDLKGFWKEIVEEVPALQFTEEIVNGQRYRKALLASHALFPIKAGSAIIDEFKIKAKIRNLTNFGYGQAHEVTKTSKRTEIKVLPLPEEGRTKSFSGAVGTYRVSLKTDGTSFPANQPFSIKVRYEGIGNAKLIDLPSINWPTGIEVYDTKSEAKFFKEGNSYKEFEILVIPRKQGEVKIPPLEFTYFDPAQKKYVSDSTQELTLQITAGTLAAPPSTSITTTPEAPVASFKAQPILQLPEAGFSFGEHRLLFYLFLLLGGISAVVAATWMQIKNLNVEPANFAMIQQKLQAVEKFQSAGDVRKIGSEATNLIYLLVASLAGQKKADQEIHLLIKEISSKDQQTYLDRINDLFDYFQLLGFSPEEIMQAALNKKPVSSQVEQLRSLTKEIVEKLRKEDKNNT